VARAAIEVAADLEAAADLAEEAAGGAEYRE
jgi:hypothetical protein